MGLKAVFQLLMLAAFGSRAVIRTLYRALCGQ
jgi:hypothetical protein